MSLFSFAQVDDEGNEDIIIVSAANYNVADAYMKLTFGFHYPYYLRADSGQNQHIVVGRIPSKASVLKEVVTELRRNGVNV